VVTDRVEAEHDGENSWSVSPITDAVPG